MKKKLLSVLLCVALLFGVFPLGLTAFAEKPEVKEMTDITARVDVSGNLLVTFSGVATAEEYYVQCGSYYGHKIYVKDESENAGKFSVNLGNIFFDFGTGERYCGKYRVRVYAQNFYSEKIAEGYSDYFKGPYEKYIAVPRRSYISSTGVYIFEPVEGAETYDIECIFNGKHLKSVNGTTRNWLDISDIARDGDNYYFKVTVRPKSNKVLPSIESEYMQYSADKELAGSVSVNDDRSLKYDWYLGYLHTHTSTELSVQWQKYSNDGEWVNINESEKYSVAPYDLRVKVTAAGHNGEVISSHNSYTDPDHPYFATDYSGLRSVFNQHRDRGQTAYIVLMNDIEGAKGYGLATDEGNVDLDLNGHTLSYKGDNRYLIRTGNASYDDHYSNVTIRDSGGTGKVVYQCTNMRYHYSHGDTTNYHDDYLEFNGADTTVLTGNITVYGGTFINNSHILFYSYPAQASNTLLEKIYAPYTGYGYGDGLKMYGGTFEAYTPVILEPSTINKDFGLFGGTLRATGPLAVDIQFGRYDDSAYKNMPQIRKTEIINASGDSKAVALNAGYWHNADVASAKAYEDFGRCFIPETRAYIDGVEQSAVTNGTVFDGFYDITGPIFSERYEIKTPTTVHRPEYTITEPAVGEFPDYTVEGYDDSLYTAKLYWYYEATPDNFAEMDPGSMFHSGIYYQAVIILEPKDGVDLTVTGNVTVGSHQADKYGLMFTTSYYINDNFFDIYIGSTHVGRKSKGDVLGDGGSVQIYEPGEYVPDADDIGYGFTASDFADKPVLVLNNFNLDRADYHPDEYNPAQFYIDESAFVLLKGENSLYHMTDADGIRIGNECSVHFIGDGSLTADLDQCDQNSLSGWGAKVYFNEAVNVTLKGIYGINLESGHDPGEEAMVVVDNNATLTCGAYLTSGSNPKYYPAFSCEYLYIQDDGAIICDGCVNGEAMHTGGVSFSNGSYTIKVLERGEYGIEPYKPSYGVNTGSDKEGDFHYISIYPGQSVIDFVRVNITEPKAGDPITYEASVPSGRGYEIEDYNTTVWSGGVMWRESDKNLNKSGEYVFENGKTYTVCISLVLTDETKRQFEHPYNMTASVNGNSAELERYSDNNYAVLYTFTINEETYIKGDVNNDGAVTDQDAIYLLFNFFFGDTYPVNQPCDFNADGSVTDQDAIYLLFHFFFSDAYPLN